MFANQPSVHELEWLCMVQLVYMIMYRLFYNLQFPLALELEVAGKSGNVGLKLRLRLFEIIFARRVSLEFDTRKFCFFFFGKMLLVCFKLTENDRKNQAIPAKLTVCWKWRDNISYLFLRWLCEKDFPSFKLIKGNVYVCLAYER